MSERASQPSKFWTGGINSLLHPADIADSQYAWAENVMNRGGILQTRAGYEWRGTVPGKNLQGFARFTPSGALPMLLVAVDGLIYRGMWPNFTFTVLPGVNFDPKTQLVNFCECLKSVNRKTDGNIELIDPKRVIMIADGINSTVMYDGVTAVEMVPTTPQFQTPTGLWMAWASSRLWISTGSQVRVSNTGDPSDFTEDQSLATRSYFQMPDIVTGMIEAPSKRGTLVFTMRTTTAFRSNIRNKVDWQNTPDFAESIPGVGCIGGRTAINQYGMTYWFSLNGMVSLDAAHSQQMSSRLLTMDSAMMRSKMRLSPDMQRACGIAFENLLLVSVPSGGKYNEQTWMMDQSPLDDESQQPGVWASIWTGTRPMGWAEGYIGGKHRLFFASYDRTPAGGSRIHVWEALRADRKDAGGRIHCQVQLGCNYGPRMQQMKYAEFEVTEALGEVDLKVYVGGSRGPWMQIAEHHISAEEGCIGYIQTYDNSTILESFKPQSRTLRTREFSPQLFADSPEYSGNTPGRDKGFSLLFEWKGQMGIHDVRLVASEASESDRGTVGKSEEGQTNIVLETGEVQPA